MRREKINVDRYKLDIFKSLGGQDRIFCGCDDSVELNPFIITGRRNGERKHCSCFECNKSEKYICSKCEFRLCNMCYNQLVDEKKPMTLTKELLEKLRDGTDDIRNEHEDADLNESKSVSSDSVVEPNSLDADGDDDRPVFNDTGFTTYDDVSVSSEETDDSSSGNYFIKSKNRQIQDNVERFVIRENDGTHYRPVDRMVSIVKVENVVK